MQDNKSNELIEALSKMPPMVIATAYLNALNYVQYGEDVTEKWLTATQNASALEKAYKKGYYDALGALQRQVESILIRKAGRWENGCCSECGCDAPAYIIDWKWQKDMNAKYCPNCGVKMVGIRETEETNDN